ncbi:ATP-dependent DNA helicase RecG [bacterium]|nr:ATP-dependent DNA helicase RecG [bacterium]
MSRPLLTDTSVQYIKGIGPKRAGLLHKIGIETVEDLLFYFPRRYLDRSNLIKIAQLKPDVSATIAGRIYSVDMVSGRRKRLVVLVGDGSGFLSCVWFQAVQYVAKVFKAGDTVAFSGKVTVFRGPQMVHPEYDIISGENETDPLHTGGIIPLYPSTEALKKGGFDSRGFRRVIHQVLSSMPPMEETLPLNLLSRHQFMALCESLQHMHYPSDWRRLRQAQTRLKFEELFYLQLYLALQRKMVAREDKGISFQRVGEYTRSLVSKLPFELTAAQKRVLREIRQDMKSGKPMNRLLQGDVGSGKTVVACIAMLIAVENGYQTALMAPTEILAEQHYLTIHTWLEQYGVRVVLLKGGQTAKERQNVLSGLNDGEIQIVIGTHALVQEGVEFDKLGLVVIDEQHRFGVLQRAFLRKKGIYPDVLVMTATPIPRTLALTLYGDLDVSILDEMPAGRKPVRTAWRSEGKRDAIYEYIRSELEKGRQAYIVYPLVEESEKVDLAAATEGYHTLSKSVFSDYRVGLLHGRMKSDEKDRTMRAFQAGDIDVLVSTTVIEVGVDAPNATVMLIEHAERFGLTQLHQLRGRVGRGSEASTCILLAQYPLSDDAGKRLETMVRTDDGFEIAEKDLEIRGPGELFGTRQHGLLNFKIANLATDGPILEKARKEAFSLIQDDPGIERQEHAMVRHTYQNRYKGMFGLIEVG